MPAADFNVVLKARDEATKAIRRVRDSFGDLDKVAKDHADTLRNLGIAGGTVVGALGLMAKGAATQRRTQDQLAAALDNVGVSYAVVRGEIEGVIAAQQTQTAISDEDQRAALRILVGTLGDYEKALAALPAVLDASAFSGSGLIEVSRTMSRALAGQVDTAESVGITFDKTAGFGERLAEVMSVVGGQAAAARDPFESMWESVQDLGDAIGTSFLPLADSLADSIADIAAFVESLNPGLVQTVAILGGSAGLVAVLAAVAAKAYEVAKALKALRIALAASTGGLSVLLGVLGTAAAAGTALYALDQLTDTGEAAGETVAGLGRQLGGMADQADRATDSLTGAVDASQRLGIVSDGAAKILAPFNRELNRVFADAGFATDSVEALADMFAATDLGREMLEQTGHAGDQLAKFGQQIHDQVGLYGTLTDEAQALAEAGLGSIVEVLGILPEDLRAAGGDMGAAFQDAFGQASQETQADVRMALAEVRKQFVALAGEDGLGSLVARASEDVVAETVSMSDQAQAATVAMVDAMASSIGDLDTAFAEVFAAIPETVKAGFNATAEQLEAGFNLVALGWIEQAMERLNAGVASLGSDILPFPDIAGSLPQPMDLPRLARGTGFFQGGMAWVGENGPEPVWLPRGAAVTPAHEARERGMSPGGGGMTNYGTVQVITSHNEHAFDVLDAMVRA